MTQAPAERMSTTDRPNQGALDSSQMFRINSTAMKVNDAFDKARAEARDECLWLSSICRELVQQNDELRIAKAKLLAKVAKLEKQDEPAAGATT